MSSPAIFQANNSLLKFRRLLEENDLTKAIFVAVGSLLTEKQLLMKKGTIVDATIIAAVPSTKNKERERDPQMRQTKKGKQYYFGMKAHTGVDMESGLVHTVTVTAASVADVAEAHNLLHGEEEAAILDAGYVGIEKREEIIAGHPKVEFIVASQAGQDQSDARGQAKGGKDGA